jgi:hypothetical protein
MRARVDGVAGRRVTQAIVSTRIVNQSSSPRPNGLRLPAVQSCKGIAKR